MRIGVAKEIMDHEFRVAIVPAGVEELTQDGHEVLVQAGAGAGSRISDADFEAAGARIVATAPEIWSADMVVKIKEPLPCEYAYLRPGLMLFTFLHLAAKPELLEILLARKVRAVGYETVRGDGSGLPIFAPMSQLAGKMAVQLGAAFLQCDQGGMGILLGGVPGTSHGRIVIIGAGNVGINAAKVAYGLGAQVVIIDSCHARLSYVDDIFDGKVVTLMSNRRNIREAVAGCDMLVGAALIAGARAPMLIDRDMLRSMTPGSVFVDVSIDQGGMSESSRPTNHSAPTYVEEGVIHYCVSNIPGSVPVTGTYALTNVSLGYIRELAAAESVDALRQHAGLLAGVNTWDGRLTCREVAATFGRPFSPLDI
ncbi:MAG: alanine dehydrogenase [Mariprofundaceae bacterium]